MSGQFKKILLAVLMAGQMNLWPARPAFAEEIKKFKNYSEQNYSMANPKMLEKKEEPSFSALWQVKQEAEKLLETKEKNIPTALSQYSTYQLGQLVIYFLFEFYKLPVKERQESDEGKKLFFVISNIYAYKDKPKYNEAILDQINKPLIKDPLFVDFMAVWTDKYAAYVEGEKTAGRYPMSLFNYFLEGYDQKELPLQAVPLKIDIMPMISDKAINDFLTALDVTGIKPGATRKEKIEGLIIAFGDFFSTTEENARNVLKAVLYVYHGLKEEEQKPFSKWLLGLSGGDKNKLALDVEARSKIKGLELPTEPVKKMFEESKKTKKKAESELEKMKKELDKYHPYVQEHKIWYFKDKFEEKPEGETLDALQTRVEYIEKKKAYLEKLAAEKPKEAEKAKKEIIELDKELIGLQKWLDKFELYKYLPSGQATPSAQLAMIRGHFVYIQSMYMLLSKGDAEFISYLQKLSTTNPALFVLCINYLLALDRVTGQFFTDLELITGDLTTIPSVAENFLKEANKIIAKEFTQSAIMYGQGKWQDYRLAAGYPTALTETATGEEVEAVDTKEALLYQNTAELTELEAVMFGSYVDAVATNGVEGPEEKEVVVMTVARLGALHRLLIPKYFAAITNLAEICKDNPGAYLQALEILAANIDMLVEPVLTEISPSQVLPSNVRAIINKLSYAFDEITKIEPSSLAQYSHYDLLDKNLYIEQFPPHLIKQKPPGWKPPLMTPQEAMTGQFVPYPFPTYLTVIQPWNPFTAGGVFNAYPYGGAVQLPQFNPFQIYTGTDAVKAAVKGYIDPAHVHPMPSDYFPGTYISALNLPRLINDINRAFISPLPPNYAGLLNAIGGGAAAGIVGKKESEKWEIGGAGLGSVITPTGGTAFGVAGETGGHVFGGGTMIGTRIGTIKHGVAKGKEVNIESAVGGYEKLDDGTKKLLASMVSQIWDPENPSEFVVTVDRQETAEGKAWMTARMFYIDKKGEIFELKGGQNDFVQMLNYFAGYWDKAFKTPSTLAWNVEPTAKTIEPKAKATGGGVMAFDIGKSALMAHAQIIPFLTADTSMKVSQIDEEIEGIERLMLVLDRRAEAEIERESAQTEYDNATTDEARAAAQTKIDTAQTKIDAANAELAAAGKNISMTSEQLRTELEEDITDAITRKNEINLQNLQPFMIEWTAGAGGTVFVGKEGEKTRILEVVLPGKMLKTKPVAGKEEQYTVQDAVFTVRQVEGKKAWELTFGGGVGQIAKKWIEETEAGASLVETTKMMGKGGFFFKMQAPKSSAGGGLYYEAGAMDVESIAMLQEAESAKKYVESLHRIGITVYGTKEAAAKLVLGGLAHIMPQFKELEEGGYAYDKTFWRFIGILKGLHGVGKLDISRLANYDKLMTDYNKLMKDVNNDPSNVATMMKNFEDKYANQMEDALDRYYLGAQISKTFSLEFILVAREEKKEGKSEWQEWADQQLDTVYGKTLFTWGSGFIRAFTAVPVSGPAKIEGAPIVGMAGAGMGFEFLNGFWLQRVAFDAGVLLAIKEQEDEAGVKKTILYKDKLGAFSQGAVLLFSNILEDSKLFRKLEKNYEKYSEALEEGKFSKMPEEIRLLIYNEVPEGIIGEALMKKIKDGETIPTGALTAKQTEALSDALWHWFYDEKSKLEEKFNGKVRMYLAGSGYFFSDKTYWDAGTFFEVVDKVKAYVIAAGREEVTLYSGVDITVNSKVTVGAVGSVTMEKPEKVEGGGGLSVKIKLGPGELGIYGYGTSAHPKSYSHPAYIPFETSKTPEFGAFIFYTITFGSGGGKINVGPVGPPPATGPQW